MFFSAKDRKIPISDLVLTDDLSMYHQTITFLIETRIYEANGAIEFDSHKIKVRVLNQMLVEGTRFKTTCVSEAIYKTFNSVCEGYNGFTTLNSLFSKLGFDYKSDFKSNNTYFSIPRCKVVTLMNMLTKHASFANGGGAHFYIDSEGVINGYDYKLIKEKAKAIDLRAELVSESANTEWSNFSAGEYELLYWGNDNKFKKEDLKLEKGYGKMSVPICDTTGVWKNVLKQELTNEFYNRYLSSRQIFVTIMEASEQIKLGQLVNLNQWNELMIVRSVVVTYDEVSKQAHFSATLITNPSY